MNSCDCDDGRMPEFWWLLCAIPNSRLPQPVGGRSVLVSYPAALGLIPYSHSQRAKASTTCTPHAQARLLNIDSAIVFHHSSSAPTSRARGHNATYFGIDTIDRPATTSGTVTHHATPAVAATLATRSSQNSGARSARRKVRDSLSSFSLIALNPNPATSLNTHVRATSFSRKCTQLIYGTKVRNLLNQVRNG